ncbi:hypothetical protein F5Y14DRAFT_414594 [Nemania sp. NC0429]|nr:hypothetical protein F5Y14DRAFT_414594 [Nemania sp. NC0429]
MALLPVHVSHLHVSLSLLAGNDVECVQAQQSCDLLDAALTTAPQLGRYLWCGYPTLSLSPSLNHRQTRYPVAAFD